MVEESSSDRTVTMTSLMTPDMSNFAGYVHGGHILKLIDQVAYICASRYAGHYVVTLAVEQVLFRESIKVGSLVNFKASINYVGKTSMEVGIKITAEDVVTKEVKHTNSCYVTMVAIDADGKSVPVKPYEPKTEKEISRYEHAKLRRRMRQEVFRQKKSDK